MQWGKGFSPLFGIFAVRALKKFQKRVGLRPDGEYGPRTHNALVRAGGFDAYGAKLMASVKVTTDAERRRSMITSAAFYCYARAWDIHYTQGAMRMQGVRQRIRLPNYPRWEDCSSWVTWLYWQAGVKRDPNGLGYNGYGYTGTLARTGRVTSNPEPGDLVFYGPAPYRHVAVYVGGGRAIGHGSESGPHLLPVHYRSDFSHYRSYL